MANGYDMPILVRQVLQVLANAGKCTSYPESWLELADAGQRANRMAGKHSRNGFVGREPAFQGQSKVWPSSDARAWSDSRGQTAHPSNVAAS